MVQTLEIQGDEVRIVETQVVRKAALKDLMPHLVQRPPISIPNLPRTAVFVHWDEQNPMRKVMYLLAELNPGVRTITKGYGGSKRKYRLAFPWTYFWFVCVNEGTRWAITNYKAFHTPKQYNGQVSAELFTAFCPNINRERADICFGSTGAPPGPIDTQIDWIVNNWYVTEFNDHLDAEMTYPFNGRNFKNWVDETAKNPACWTDFPEWTNGKRKKWTVQDLLSDANLNIRPEVLEAAYVIPEIKVPLTFGYAEEWLKEKVPNPTDRYRLLKSLEVLVKENPGFVEEPVADFDTTGALDDGGIPA